MPKEDPPEYVFEIIIVTAQVARKISLFRLLKTAEIGDKGGHELIA